MPKISAKRQITLPMEQCLALDLRPGDSVESFVVDGQLTLVKKIAGAAKGLLSHVQINTMMTDDESLQDSVSDRY